MQSIRFDLKYSLSKFLLKLFVMFVLFFCLMEMLSIFMVFAILILLLFALYFLRNKQIIEKIEYLSDDEWNIKFRSSSVIHRYQLQHIRILGYFCFLKFHQLDTVKSDYVCIAKDQLKLEQWKMLQRVHSFL